MYYVMCVTCDGSSLVSLQKELWALLFEIEHLKTVIIPAFLCPAFVSAHNYSWEVRVLRNRSQSVSGWGSLLQMLYGQIVIDMNSFVVNWSWPSPKGCLIYAGHFSVEYDLCFCSNET